jgi:hypothetical protein
VSKQSGTSIKLAAAIVLLVVLAGCATRPSPTPGTYTITIKLEDNVGHDTAGT